MWCFFDLDLVFEGKSHDVVGFADGKAFFAEDGVGGDEMEEEVGDEVFLHILGARHVFSWKVGERDVAFSGSFEGRFFDC